MLTYQRSKIWSPQSCSQSANSDEEASEQLPFAAYEQLWLTYKAMQRTASRPMTSSQRVNEVRPRKDHRGVDYVSVTPFTATNRGASRE